jgi:hypothetical protein
VLKLLETSERRRIGLAHFRSIFTRSSSNASGFRSKSLSISKVRGKVRLSVSSQLIKPDLFRKSSVADGVRFHLADISVVKTNVRRSGVVVRERGVEGWEALSLCAGHCGIVCGKKRGTRAEIRAWFKELFDGKV